MQMVHIVLASNSLIKREALAEFVSSWPHFGSQTVNMDFMDVSGVPPQLITEGGLPLAKAKTAVVKSKRQIDETTFYLSIENGLDLKRDLAFCSAYLEFGKESLSAVSFGVPIDNYYELLETLEPLTVGAHRPVADADANANADEYVDAHTKNVQRDGRLFYKQIANALFKLFKKVVLVQAYNIVPDYPKPGVMFQDMMPLLYDAKLFNYLIDLIIDRYRGTQIDVVAGLESRGFVLGAAIAYSMHCGFVPMRKIGKLPGPVIRQEYQTEYSKDTLELQVCAIQPGHRVLIVDDVIATGGSLKAAVDLVHRSGAEVVDLCVVRDVPPLREVARKTLSNRPVTIIL